MGERKENRSLSQVYLDMLDRFSATLHVSRLMRRAWMAVSNQRNVGMCFTEPCSQVLMKICLSFWQRFYRSRTKKRKTLVLFTWHREMMLVRTALLAWMGWQSEQEARRRESRTNKPDASVRPASPLDSLDFFPFRLSPLRTFRVKY